MKQVVRGLVAGAGLGAVMLVAVLGAQGNVKVDLKDAQFLRCDFGQCDMRAALLTGSAFSHCGLYRSDLRSAEAAGVEFFRCLCRKTDFTGARLLGAAFVQSERGGSIPPEGAAQQARSSA